MNIEEFSKLVVDAMGVEPTEQQRALIDALSRFCSAETPSLSVFLLNGYAGTGKTSVVAALVKALSAVRCPVVLLAPTGRAAKVLSNMAGRKAMTIHRKIYRSDTIGNTVSIAGVADNPHNGAIFIVDEASMIGTGETSSLLDDLCQYVYSGNDCRMILLGDAAQLPPVGCDRSPAMSVSYLHNLGLRVSRAILTQTVRQHSRSGILFNATRLRRGMKLPELPVPTLVTTPFPDLHLTSGEDLADNLSAAYSRYGIAETILITRSNRRARDYNLAIRGTILEKEEILTAGEPVLISKNNYFWTSPRNRTSAYSNNSLSTLDFIANGDIATINRIHGFEDIDTLRFADVEITLPDREITLEAKIILNSLTSDDAALDRETELKLYNLALANLDPVLQSNPAAVAAALRSDPYFNALRVKYAYAVTCHKAQGGQWESVFVDMAAINPEAFTTIDFHRWLYTAITRAKTSLTFIAPTLPLK